MLIFNANQLNLLQELLGNSFDPLTNINILGFQSLFTRAPSTRLHNSGKNHKKPSRSIFKYVIKIIVLILGYALSFPTLMLSRSAYLLAML
jgi:hypothetical protein